MLTENAGKHVDQKETEVKEKVSKKKEKELEKQVNEFPTDDMIDGDIDLSETRKKRFRINGDNSKILEINVANLSNGFYIGTATLNNNQTATFKFVK